MTRIDQGAAGPGVTDVADVEHPPFALPEPRSADPTPRDSTSPSVGTVLRRGNVFGHRVEVLEALLDLVEGARQVEDHLAALPGDHPPGGERAAVANRLDVVDDRDVGPARAQEVARAASAPPG